MLKQACAAIHRQVGRFFSRENGNAAITFAIAALPIVVGVGSAVDYTRGSKMKAKLQTAMDNAVLAAVLDGSPNWQAAASNAFNTYLSNSGGLPPDAPTFTVNNGIYSGTIATTLPTTVMGVMGIKTLNVNVVSAATNTTVPLCILGLNAFDNGAFDMNGNATFSAKNCAVQANTVNNRGMTQEGNPSASASKFGVTGGHTGTNYSTMPKDGSQAVSDPYANIPFPQYDSCDSTKSGLTIHGGTVTLSPGTYCGGIKIDAQASVTLNPGVYVMVGGPLWLDGGSNLNGQNVMVAFTGSGSNNASTLYVWGNSTLTLTSPSSGPYTNMQFFGDPTDANGRGAWVSLGGNGNNQADGSKATWDGVAYFPNFNFWVYGNPVVNANSPSMVLVAGQIWIQGSAIFNVTHNNPRNLTVSEITTTGGARLVQ
ncbi:MAG TPA: TadE/TadG family type IV pilus assembly protein [Pseudolabrys sp.]|nr:TadE/TadG family type IV pilus assembly protein [Pseudolabrys sp.]